MVSGVELNNSNSASDGKLKSITKVDFNQGIKEVIRGSEKGALEQL